MKSELYKLQKAVKSIRKITDFEPEVCIVLGSGLGSLADYVDNPIVIPYGKIKYMPISTTSSHEGKLYFGILGNTKVMLYKGRVHMYEGYSVEEVVRPIRLAGMLGAKKLILTNSAGGINRDYKVGDVVLIKDFISSFVPSPHKGDIRRQIGSKLEFFDMTKVYSDDTYDKIKEIGKNYGILFKEGVYLQVTGAQYETPAEIKFYERAGADLVGMSTVVEAIAGRHMNMEICAMSTVTNMAAGITGETLSHDEVKREGEIVAKKLGLVLIDLLK